MRKVFSFILCGIVIFSFTRVFAQTKYKTYSNARFGYSISYPSDLLEPQGEATNGDGQKFIAKDSSAEMLVYGRYKLDSNDTLKKMYNETIADSGNASYKVFKSNWFVVSGKKGDKIYYKKTMLSRDKFLTFEIEYDEAKRSTYDNITTRIVKSFVGL
jgi:hypothetical protein